MEQNTRVFYANYGDASGYAPEGGPEYGQEYGQQYGEGQYEEGPYEEGPYEGYDPSMAYEDGAEEEFPQEGDYSVYNEELEGGHRAHWALGVMDTVSVLAGVVVILALTALIISLVSWLRTDITHSFVILQSRIQ